MVTVIPAHLVLLVDKNSQISVLNFAQSQEVVSLLSTHQHYTHFYPLSLYLDQVRTLNGIKLT